MENQLRIFQNEEFGLLGVLMIDGNPYFPAAQCASVLGYARPHDAISRHCRDSVKHGVIDSLGRTQETIFIPEWDLYRLIFRSKLPAAVRFEQFVVKEVLPSIRKHGAYITPETLEQVLQNEAFRDNLLQKLYDESKKNEALLSRIEAIAPKARLYDLIMHSSNAIPVTLVAKDYGMSAVSFNRLLCEMHIQFKMGETWVLHQPYADKGYTKTRTYHANEDLAVVHTYWTMRGRVFLYDKLAACGIFPVPENPVPAEKKE